LQEDPISFWTLGWLGTSCYGCSLRDTCTHRYWQGLLMFPVLIKIAPLLTSCVRVQVGVIPDHPLPTSFPKDEDAFCKCLQDPASSCNDNRVQLFSKWFFGFFEKDYYSLTNQNDFGLIDQAKQWCYNRNLDTYEKTRDW
jgi:hypothetical protein